MWSRMCWVCSKTANVYIAKYCVVCAPRRSAHQWRKVTHSEGAKSFWFRRMLNCCICSDPKISAKYRTYLLLCKVAGRKIFGLEECWIVVYVLIQKYRLIQNLSSLCKVAGGKIFGLEECWIAVYVLIQKYRLNTELIFSLQSYGGKRFLVQKNVELLYMFWSKNNG